MDAKSYDSPLMGLPTSWARRRFTRWRSREKAYRSVSSP